ncbi:Uncharacterized protein BP5553_00750 [Venustampulla echinocandica]|uniref:Mediator of RNA polymerase II transcription subunit 11 n=1 Tax=Venustampulla echinocandica TaxID=2656787 RepID=A0A370TZ15_9HELO|nr:Uncharacterized protein BP5553_00750 [Venustampulla echinocandica]RDL40771.1 Uncharacterized protein BP5553_00750 [Venustampulla echinocandica]
MSLLVSGEAEPPAFKPFTKAERIQQLNDIDKSITQLLQSAGLALKTLTSAQSASRTSERREAFETASNAYLRALRTVDVGLKRQIYGLEEADIIPAEKTKAKGKQTDDGPAMGSARATVPTEATVAEGGMGKLDIGWLNSRSGRVERDMEAELWGKARGFVEGLEGSQNGLSNDAGKERTEGGEDEYMAI